MINRISYTLPNCELTPFKGSAIIYGPACSGKTTHLQKILLTKTGKGVYYGEVDELSAPNATLEKEIFNTANKPADDEYDFIIADVSSAYSEEKRLFQQRATREFVSSIEKGLGGAITVECDDWDFLTALAKQYHADLCYRAKTEKELIGPCMAAVETTKKTISDIFKKAETAAICIRNFNVAPHIDPTIPDFIASFPVSHSPEGNERHLIPSDRDSHRASGGLKLLDINDFKKPRPWTRLRLCIMHPLHIPTIIKMWRNSKSNDINLNYEIQTLKAVRNEQDK